ncbi:hypothetical protein DMC30DRAFT_405676, partial [Rhodotorula diobovata]
MWQALLSAVSATGQVAVQFGELVRLGAERENTVGGATQAGGADERSTRYEQLGVDDAARPRVSSRSPRPCASFCSTPTGSAAYLRFELPQRAASSPPAAKPIDALHPPRSFPRPPRGPPPSPATTARIPFTTHRRPPAVPALCIDTPADGSLLVSGPIRPSLQS